MTDPGPDGKRSDGAGRGTDAGPADTGGREVQPYDHVRPSADTPVPEGIYRVVGSDRSEVTLLLVADREGRRINSGTIERVDRATLETFETAENPDAGFSPSDLLDPFTAFGSALRHWLGL